MRIIQVIYTPKGDVTSDEGVDAYVNDAISYLKEYPTRQEFSFRVGTEILITAFRVAVKQGRIPDDTKVVVYSGESWRSSRINKDGRFSDDIVPFNSVNDQLMEALL